MLKMFLVLAIASVLYPRPSPVADFPSGPGVGFAPVSLGRGQILRVTAGNVEPPEAMSAERLASGSCAGGVSFEFYNDKGELLKRKSLKNLQPGKSAAVELSRQELPDRPSAIEVRAVILFGYGGGTPLDRESARILRCKLVPSLEVSEKADGRTVLKLTDAKPLPGPNPPRK